MCNVVYPHGKSGTADISFIYFKFNIFIFSFLFIFRSQINSKLVYRYIWAETLFSVFEIAPTISDESWEKWAVLITINAHVANELGASMYLLNGLAGDNYLGLHKIVGDDTHSVQVSIEGKQIKMVPYNSDGANASFMRLL